MFRNVVEISEEINGRKHSYICPQDSPCEEVIAYCKAIIEHCEKRLEESKLEAEKKNEEKKDEPIEVKDVGCCSV